MHELMLRVVVTDDHFLGPGKVRLLELIDQTGSISAAARLLDMSYRRAWLLVDSLNAAFREPVLTSAVGGRQGGGAALTALGREVVTRYRRMESRTRAAIAADVEALRAKARNGHARGPAKRRVSRVSAGAARGRTARG